MNTDSRQALARIENPIRFASRNSRLVSAGLVRVHRWFQVILLDRPCAWLFSNSFDLDPFWPGALADRQMKLEHPVFHFSADLADVDVRPEFEQPPVIRQTGFAIAEFPGRYFRLSPASDGEFNPFNGDLEPVAVDARHVELDQVFALTGRDVGWRSREGPVKVGVALLPGRGLRLLPLRAGLVVILSYRVHKSM